jgi:hypothetical protein
MYNNNVVSDRNMGEKSESEVKVMEEVYEMVAEATMIEIRRLEERIIRMERAFDALGRRLEGSERHVEDEGWFD